MSDLLQAAEVYCPYCGESVELLLDGSAGEQEYIEDCAVCCRPMVIFLRVGDSGELSVETRHEDET